MNASNAHIPNTLNDVVKHIKEIKPQFKSTEHIADDLYKATIGLTPTRDLNLLYLNDRNMINMTNLVKTTIIYQIDHNKLTIAERERLKDPEKLNEYIRNRIYRKITSIRMIKRIDNLSLSWYGKFHYSYNGKPIWNEIGSIIPEVLDSNSHIKKSLLSEEKDNLIETINEGNSPLSGTWMNYEFLPKILSSIDEDYDTLALHCDTIIIANLKNTSLLDHTLRQQRTSLLSQLRIDNIKTLEKANDKGREAEQLVLEGMQEVFKSVIKTNKNHNCDIEAENGEILVEVKAVQYNVKADRDKFIEDLITHQETVHIGIYINIFDNKLHTYYFNTEYGFTVWFINPSDFTYELLNIIRQSNKAYDKEITLTRIANQKAKQTIFVKEVQEELLDRLEKRWELHEQALIARHNLNENNGKTMFTADAKTIDKMNRDVQREKDLPKFNELVKEFIKLHYQDFKNGYHTKTCRIDIDEFVKSHGIKNMGFDIIGNALNSYVYSDRHPSIPNGPKCYFFIQGLDEQFTPIQEISENITQDTPMTLNVENIVLPDDSPTMDEVFNGFIQRNDIHERLYASGGFKQENISKKFKYFIQTQICRNYPTISHKRYTDLFSSYVINLCIQIERHGKRYYIPKETEEAQHIIQIFDDITNLALERNNFVSYEEVKQLYKESNPGPIYLTKLTMQPKFIELKKVFESRDRQELNSNQN